MFTLEQINEIHDRLGNAETLALYLQELNSIGVDSCESFINDGHSEYHGHNGLKVVSPPAHEPLEVASTIDRASFLEHLERVNQGKTGYLEMSQGLASSGIEKWTFDTHKLTMTDYDKAGTAMLIEALE